MPTYEYVCAKCEHVFEFAQSIAAEPLNVCPREACAKEKWGKGRVKRAISGGGGLLFKGSGFYITDYRSENYKSGAKKEKESTTPAPAGGEAKTAAPKKEAKAAVAKSPSD
ncbi:MAG: zinc ribbon domain-containing protein [Verrucomicrobia bacterium]|nr:zinc ribbon domain-containing protein [Verrucomicrobiota bacterium]